MASTKADKNKVAWTYTDDDANDWRVSAPAVYVLDGTDGTKYGGEAALPSVAGKPLGLRMRKREFTSAAGKTLWIVCYDTACDAWATPATTLTRDINGTDTTVTRGTGSQPEQMGRQTKQAS